MKAKWTSQLYSATSSGESAALDSKQAEDDNSVVEFPFRAVYSLHMKEINKLEAPHEKAKNGVGEGQFEPRFETNRCV